MPRTVRTPRGRDGLSAMLIDHMLVHCGWAQQAWKPEHIQSTEYVSDCSPSADAAAVCPGRIAPAAPLLDGVYPASPSSVLFSPQVVYSVQGSTRCGVVGPTISKSSPSQKTVTSRAPAGSSAKRFVEHTRQTVRSTENPTAGWQNVGGHGFPQPHRPTVSANGLEYGVS
jgi:hypothetical protein